MPTAGANWYRPAMEHKDQSIAMKTFFVAALIVCTAAIAGWRFATAWKTPSTAAPSQAAQFSAKATPSTKVPVSRPSPARPAIALEPPDAPTRKATSPDAGVLSLATAIETLTSAQSSFGQKHAIWEQLRKTGQLDEALAALDHLATENPDDPVIHIALGEAEINQIGEVMANGGNFNVVSLLGVQADEDFNAALALDPTSWEAQFDKASALSHWPAGMNKSPEVIQRLSALIVQQETMVPQPEFAQTYLLLGEQYQAAGQKEKAAQIWRQGAALFPLNSAFQSKLARAVNPQLSR